MRFLHYIDKLNDWVSKLFSPVFILIILFAVYEVVRRYILNNPTIWVWEVNSQLLCFIGGNATDITDLGAEIEFCMGEEQEKHIINKTAVVSIPANLVHCPINITKVDKPIVFLEVSLTSNYGMPVARSQ